MKNKFYFLLVIITCALLVIEYFLSDQNLYFTRNIVFAGTLIVAAISALSYFIASRSVDNENPNRFVRGVMGGTFLKFFLCIVAAVIFVFVVKKNLHKPDLYLLMFVYLIYTVAETAFLYSISKKK